MTTNIQPFISFLPSPLPSSIFIFPNIMKLSDHIAAVDTAFATLMATFTENDTNLQQHQHHPGLCICRDLPRMCDFSAVPWIPSSFSPLTPTLSTNNKERLLRLAAFETTYHDAQTFISPNMVPLIINTGASISVSPYETDFISKIKPVQAVEIKGIAAGLTVRGFRDVSYTFRNDDQELQTMILRDCLYVPQCTARLICPRQIGQAGGDPSDGFAATMHDAVLTFHGKQTTISYDHISNLPILYTASGVSSFHRFCANNHQLLQHPTGTPLLFLTPNLSPRQQRKLHLHERCAHAHWEQINSWLRAGTLPGGTSLASEPDPVCAACQFGKAQRRSHKADTGHISETHQAPGDGVSSNGMEAGCPGRLMTRTTVYETLQICILLDRPLFTIRLRHYA
jgi:hypothetical protein